MAVAMPREKWTDERLDDLNAKVDRGFAETKEEMRKGFDRLEARMDGMDRRFEVMDRRFEGVEAQTDRKFEGVEARMESMEARPDMKFGELHQRFDRLQQTLIGGTVAIAAAIVGSNAF